MLKLRVASALALLFALATASALPCADDDQSCAGDGDDEASALLAHRAVTRHDAGSSEGGAEVPRTEQLLGPGAVHVDDLVVEQLLQEVAKLPAGQIPKWIHTTWKRWDNVTQGERQAEDEWVELNPGWRYYFWDDYAMLSFLERHGSEGDRGIISMMHKIEVCDFFRYVVLERLGGLYFDIDVSPKLPIDRWWRRDDVNASEQPTTDQLPQLITGWEARCESEEERSRMGFARMDQLQQWLILSAPHHPVLQDVLHRIRSRFEQAGDDLPLGSGRTLNLTGPGVWTDAVLAHVGGVVPPRAGRGEGLANRLIFNGNASVWILPKDSFAWTGWPVRGNRSEVLALHHFMGSWKQPSA